VEACEGCGLATVGGTAGCQALFDQFRARELTELAAAYTSARLTIDVYCLQHPDRYCVSAKSLAAHLTGVCWAIERRGNEWGLRILQRWLDGQPKLDKPAIPAQRGARTIGDVARVDAGQYPRTIHEWAGSTWSAYSSLHLVARAWVDDAVSTAAKRGPGVR
jgi:hypothetical protein